MTSRAITMTPKPSLSIVAGVAFQRCSTTACTSTVTKAIDSNATIIVCWISTVSVRPKRSAMNPEVMVWMPVKTPKTTNQPTRYGRMRGSSTRSFAVGPVCTWRTGSRSPAYAQKPAAAASSAAAYIGKTGLTNASAPPKAGPRIVPRPPDMPTSAMPCARELSSVVSAM
jgi:hypothetical protein